MSGTRSHDAAQRHDAAQQADRQHQRERELGRDLWELDRHLLANGLGGLAEFLGELATLIRGIPRLAPPPAQEAATQAERE
jgi:hypothetical protein